MSEMRNIDRSIRTDGDQPDINEGSSRANIRSPGQTDLGSNQNIKSCLSQSANQIDMDTRVGQNFKHNLSGNHQDFFFAQNAGSVTKCLTSGFEADNRILNWNFINPVASFNQAQNIGHSDSSIGYNRLAEADFGFNNDSFGRSESLIHIRKNYTLTGNPSQIMSKPRNVTNDETERRNGHRNRYRIR